MAEARQGPDLPVAPAELRFPESVRELVGPALGALGYAEVASELTSVSFDGPAGNVQTWVFSTRRGANYELSWSFAPKGYKTAWRTSFYAWQMMRVLPDVREVREPFLARTEKAMRPGLEKIAADIQGFAAPFLAGDAELLVNLDEMVGNAYRRFPHNIPSR